MVPLSEVVLESWEACRSEPRPSRVPEGVEASGGQRLGGSEPVEDAAGPPPPRRPLLELTLRAVPSGAARVELEGWGRAELAGPCVCSAPAADLWAEKMQVAPGGETQAAPAVPAASPGPVAAKMAPGGHSAFLAGGLVALAAILLLGAATPYSGGELMTPQETALPQYPFCPSSDSGHEQAAAAKGGPAFGVCPAGVPTESSDRDPLPPLRVILDFTVAEPAALSMGGGGVLLPFPRTPAGPAPGGQLGLVPKGSVALPIPAEFPAAAEAVAEALVPSSSGRANRKGALTVAPPLAGEAVMRMDGPGLVVVPVNGTDSVMIFFPIQPPPSRPPPDPPPFQLSIGKGDGEVLGKVK